MKYSISFVPLAGITLFSLAEAGQTTTTVNTGSGSAKAQPGQTISPQLSVPVVPRDLAHLFRRAPPKPAGGKGHGGKKSGAKPGKGVGGGHEPLTQEDIIECINHGTKFPDALEEAFKSSSLSKQFKRPPKLKPASPKYKDHPATEAIKILKAKDIPPAIMEAAKAKWGGGKGSAKGAQGKASGKAGAGKAKGGKSKGGKGKRDIDDKILPARDFEDAALMARAADAFQMPDLISKFKHAKRNADDEELVLAVRAAKGGGGKKGGSNKGSSTGNRKLPTSNQVNGAFNLVHKAIGVADHAGQAYGNFQQSQQPVMKRDVRDTAMPNVGLLEARDAGAQFDDVLELYRRDAEAYDLDGDFDELFARDAEADAFPDPDAWAYADDYELVELLAREAEAEAEASKKFTAENVDGLAELLQDNHAAAHAVAKALNADPKLAKYAKELDRDFGDGENTDDKEKKEKKKNKRRCASATCDI